jgi:hypothetical protein
VLAGLSTLDQLLLFGLRLHLKLGYLSLSLLELLFLLGSDLEVVSTENLRLEVD